MSLKEKLHIEKKLLDWIVENKYQIFLLILLYGLLKASSLLPYVNLFINSQIVVLAVSITAIFILDIGIKRPLLVGLLLFVPALVFQLIGEFNAAEIVGNLIFGIFSVTVMVHIFKYKHLN